MNDIETINEPRRPGRPKGSHTMSVKRPSADAIIRAAGQAGFENLKIQIDKDGAMNVELDRPTADVDAAA